MKKIKNILSNNILKPALSAVVFISTCSIMVYAASNITTTTQTISSWDVITDIYYNDVNSKITSLSWWGVKIYSGTWCWTCPYGSYHSGASDYCKHKNSAWTILSTTAVWTSQCHADRYQAYNSMISSYYRVAAVNKSFNFASY